MKRSQVGSSLADAAKCFNVSCSAVQRQRYHIKSEDSVSRKQVLNQRWVRASTENCLLCLSIECMRSIIMPQLITDPFVAPGTRIPSSIVRKHSLNLSINTKRPFLCVFPPK
ncbi:hypothetical protein TNCV_5122951 [Trichonephila clavipes]|nr:hypothetical protein TNCV_5122951 [Trichonephila clavipes]